MFSNATRLLTAAAVLIVALGTAWAVASDWDLYGITVFSGFALTIVALLVTSVVLDGGWIEAGDGPAVPAGGARPAQPSTWPVVGAFGVGAIVVGAAVDGFVVGLGVALVLVAAIEWSAQSWSEMVSGSAEHNRAIRNRAMLPFEIPIGVVAAIAVGILSFSRVLLALPKEGSTITAGAVATTIVVVMSIIATRPHLSRTVAKVVMVVAGLTVIVGGIVGAAVGERDIHHSDEPGAAAHSGEQG